MYAPLRRSAETRPAAAPDRDALQLPAASAGGERNSATGRHRVSEIAIEARPPVAGAVVQRKVGVEYETAIEAKTPDDKPVPQDETMVTAAGWHIDSDNSKLEFVTDPPVDIGPFAGVLGALTTALEALPLPLTQETTIEQFVQGATSYTRSYKVQKYDRLLRLTGSPQGSVGIKFEKLFAFFSFLASRNLEMNGPALEAIKTVAAAKKLDIAAATPATDKDLAGKNPAQVTAMKLAATQKADASVSAAKKRPQTALSANATRTFKELPAKVWTVVAPHAAALPKSDLDKLKGLLHFVGQYAVFSVGYESTSYKKQALPVMSRTSFAAMYAALGEAAQAAFVDAAPNLVTALGLEADSVAWSQHKMNFSIGTWLDTISNPVSVQTREGARPESTVDDADGPRFVDSDLMTMPGAFGAGKDWGTDKSMGARDNLEDGLVVVELRTIKQFGDGSVYNVASLKAFLADLKAFDAFT